MDKVHNPRNIYDQTKEKILESFKDWAPFRDLLI